MQPLAGKRIVVTRAAHQAEPLSALLQANGAIPILYPCIAITPPDDPAELDAHLMNLDSFDWLILTSTNTVHALKDRLTTLALPPDWTQLRIAVVGDKTAEAFHETFQHQPDFIPDVSTAESLAKTLPIQAQQRIFIPQSAIADDIIHNLLRQSGADVTSAIAYQTTIGTGGEDVPWMLTQNKIDVLTFTSSSTISNFIQRIQPLSLPDLPALCIGSSTATTARQIGFQQIIMPQHHFTLIGMIEALIHYYQ